LAPGDATPESIEEAGDEAMTEPGPAVGIEMDLSMGVMLSSFFLPSPLSSPPPFMITMRNGLVDFLPSSLPPSFRSSFLAGDGAFGVGETVKRELA
jgi:hypothetical protein